MDIADIERMLDEPAVPPPFNGATSLLVARDVFDAINSALSGMWPRGVEMMVSAALPPGHGVGTRPWRDGDDPEMKGLQMPVFVIAPPKYDQ